MELDTLLKQHQEKVDESIKELDVEIIHLIESSNAIIHLLLEEKRQNKEIIKRLIQENLRLENEIITKY